MTRTVRGYADSVVHQAGNAVAGGAKLLQDRIVTPLCSLQVFSVFSMIASGEIARLSMPRASRNFRRRLMVLGEFAVLADSGRAGRSSLVIWSHDYNENIVS